MNILVTTLGTSWQIVPELLSITNPQNYDFFCNSSEVQKFREVNKITSIDECWIVTTEGQKDLDKLFSWANRWNENIKVFVCSGVNSFKNESEIIKMRSLIYRLVLNAKEKSDSLYLSLSGGRKTMSADMQEAGNLFGCSAMLHVVDCALPPPDMKADDFLASPNETYAKCFIPLLVNSFIPTSLVVSGDKEPISAKDYLLHNSLNPTTTNSNIKVLYNEDCTLVKAIDSRKERTAQLYANFYSKISGNQQGKRDIFRKLYFLHPDTLRSIQEYKIVKDEQKSFDLINRLPKAELHSHLGGVLTPQEIIEVAKTEKNFIVDESNKNSQLFKTKINEILSYENNPDSFERFIYKEFSNKNQFYGIGIDKYQKLGDFQGSTILQTKNTICKTVEIYAKKLISENVKYVEIRCSPYKYTKLGLSIDDVVNCIINTLDSFQNKLEYRLICIIGRESSIDDIQDSVEKILNLLERNSKFKNKLVGIDLAGNEGKTKPSELRESFMPFLKDCVKITIHAGETESVESIWEAVYHLSADRIGHGLKLLDNIDLLKRFIDKNIGIEMCPSSNNQIVGFNQTNKIYPLYEYLNRGLKVSLNTDDCGISKTTVTNEFLQAAKMCPELSLWDCLILIRNSLSIAFCDTDTKNKLMHDFENEILNICAKEFEIK